MKRMIAISIAVTASALVSAAPYPLGTMTCADMGRFASEAQGWRESGMKRDEAFERLEGRSFNDPVEKKNLERVLSMVFGSYGKAWTVESAGNAIRSDCETGR
jgi:hypothetical protein